MSPEMWVQIVLCVVVAGLLLVVAAVPRKRWSSSAVPPTRDRNSVLDALEVLRSSIRAYRTDHGAWPLAASETACGASSDAELWTQLTTRTRIDGSLPRDGAVRDLFGPYAETIDLVNPGNGLSSVRSLGPHEAWPAKPDESCGWIYCPATGELRASLDRVDERSGRPYYEL